MYAVSGLQEQLQGQQVFDVAPGELWVVIRIDAHCTKVRAPSSAVMNFEDLLGDAPWKELSLLGGNQYVHKSSGVNVWVCRGKRRVGRTPERLKDLKTPAFSGES